jgi:hypothetical protein
MLTKLCATWLLALILSPFTAPFQTYDLADSAGGTVAAADAGSLIGPPATEKGRLRLAPVSALIISNVVAAPMVLFLASPSAPRRIINSPVPTTILRL